MTTAVLSRPTALKKTARITVRQRAARQRNIVIARKARHQKTSGRSGGREKLSAALYKNAFKKEYTAARTAGLGKNAARKAGLLAAGSVAGSLSIKKAGARATHYASKKGYSESAVKKITQFARSSTAKGGTAWLHRRIHI